MSDDKILHYEKLIEDAIRGVKKEIKKSLAGEGEVSELQQLGYLAFCLNQMRDIIKNNNPDSLPEECVGMSRIAIDGWPYDAKLGEQIVEIEYLFKKVMKRRERDKKSA